MGVWIETFDQLILYPTFIVTPCVGVWIETLVRTILIRWPLSHPAWVCGLKLKIESRNSLHTKVTPCVGVWIETLRRAIGFWINKVTPCVGVWIETTNLSDSQVF